MVSFRIDREIILREFTYEDAEEVFRTVTENYEHLRPFMHWIVPDYSLELTRHFISEAIAARLERRNLGLAILRKDRFIGSIGFTTFDRLANTTEIGYWISGDEEGKGIITRATRLLIGHAFSELGMNRIEIRCSAENLRSGAIPERLGFKKEGVLRQSQFRNGKLHDFNVYGLLKSEWQPKS
ncbi:MAG: GNAT family N-acetyltransferase [Acidobacteria bacterium]|nr:GNAT family N-acetyltransferase [Acidobacteriota bacterium]